MTSELRETREEGPKSEDLPFGGLIPISSYSSGCVSGSSTDSLISWICCSSPDSRLKGLEAVKD